MRIRVLMITYNRPAYTERALSRLCETLPADARVTVWDNNSNPETRAVLRRFEGHPSVDRIIYHSENAKLHGPTNWFWQNADGADFVGKVDDDCLMPEHWCENLTKVHRDVAEAGVLGCWHFLEEDFQPALAEKKIQQFGAHRIMRNCWVGGSGYLMKRAVIDRQGLLRAGEGFTEYCTRAAALGFIIGWVYPFLYQEHMDDPRAPHTGIVTEEDFQRLRPLSARTFNTRTRQDWIHQLQRSAWRLQVYSFDPWDYLGWKAKLRQKLSHCLGRPYVPRV
jgi:GT2 family glycosyltransferase